MSTNLSGPPDRPWNGSGPNDRKPGGFLAGAIVTGIIQQQP